jgi:hypothetical protein
MARVTAALLTALLATGCVCVCVCVCVLVYIPETGLVSSIRNSTLCQYLCLKA